MRPAQHDRDPSASQAIGELVGAHGRAGDHRQADQVGLDPLRVNVLDPLVETDDFRVQLGRDQGRQGRQGERHVAERPPEDAAAVPVQRPLRRDQHDSQLAVLHGSCPGPGNEETGSAAVPLVSSAAWTIRRTRGRTSQSGSR